MSESKTIAGEVFETFVLRGVKAPLAIIRLQEWISTATNMSKIAKDMQQSQASNAVANSENLNIVMEMISRIEDEERKQEIKDYLSVIKGKVDYTDGGKITDTATIARKEREYKAKKEMAQTKFGEILLDEMSNFPDLLQKFLKAQSSVNTDSIERQSELIELKYKAIGMILESLGKDANLLDKMTINDTDDIVLEIAKEPANTVKYDVFFSFIQKQREARTRA